MKYEIEDIYREVVELYPDDFRSYLTLGYFLREIGRHNEAKKELTIALDKVNAMKEKDHDVIDDIKGDLSKPVSYKQQVRREIMNYQVDIMMNLLGSVHLTEPGESKLLDVGCGTGLRTLKLAEKVGIPRKNIIGLDIFDDAIISAKRFFDVHRVDLEFEAMPLPDESMDLIICNQVLEDMKNVTWILNEMYRVLKKSGYMLIGVPNLASFHNRLRLLLGKQPTCINIFSDHTRGYTTPSLRKLLTYHSNLEIVDFSGNGFYPLPIQIARQVSKIFPSFSVQIFFLLRKVDNNPDNLWEIPIFCQRLQLRR